jgi:hypothetical protein
MIYTTDNGPHENSGRTAARSERVYENWKYGSDKNQSAQTDMPRKSPHIRC